MNQTWGREPSDFLTVEGYRSTVGTKPLHVVNETFCLIPIDGAKWWYLIRLAFGASVGCRELAKKEKRGTTVM